MIKKRIFKERISWCGVDIRPDFTRLVILRRKNNEYHLDQLITEPTPAGALPEGQSPDHKIIGHFLRHLWGKYKIRTREVALSFEPPVFLIKTDSLSNVREEEIQKILTEKVSQYLAFSGFETSVSWEILERTLKEEELSIKVLMAVTRADFVAAYARAVEEAGLNLVAITLPPLALLRALAEENIESVEELKILLYFQEKETLIFILKNAQVTFIHPFNAGAADLEKTPEKFEELTVELQKILAQHIDVEKIIYAGSFTKIKNFLETLAVQLGQEVIPAQGTLKEDEAGKKASQDQILTGLEAIGLARKEPFKISLVPSMVFLNRELNREVTLFLLALVVFSFIFLTIFAYFFIDSFIVRRQTFGLKEKMNQSSPQFVELNNIENRIEEIGRLMAARRQKLEDVGRFYGADLLAEIARLVPGSLRLTRIDIKPDRGLILYGEFSGAGGVNSVFGFMNNLKKSSYFSNVNLPQLEQTAAGTGPPGGPVRSFSLELKITGGGN